MEADLRSIADFAFLPNGEMLVSDNGLARIFRIGADGLVRNYAGNGLVEHSGDGGPAAEAGLLIPSRIAVDGAGNTYVSTSALLSSGAGVSPSARLVRRISPSGEITTVAGNGEYGCPVDGAAALASPLGHIGALAAGNDGSVYLAIGECRRIYRIENDGTIRVYAGADPSEALDLPYYGMLPSVQVSLGIVTDLSVAANSDLIAVLAGPLPYAVRFTPEGVGILLTGTAHDQLSNREGTATSVTLWNLNSAAPLPDGRIVLGQNGAIPSATVRQELGVADTEGSYGIIFTSDEWDGSPGSTYQGRGVAPDLVRIHPSGAIFLLDRNRRTIFRAAEDGTLTPFAGRLSESSAVIEPGEQPLFKAGINNSFASDANGNIYFASMDKLFRLKPDGSLEHISGNGGISPVSDDLPPLESALDLRGQISVDAAGNIYWASFSQTIIRRLSPEGEYSTILGNLEGDLHRGSLEGLNATSVRVQFTHWDVTPDGALYFWARYPTLTPSSFYGDQIWRVGSDGIIRRHAGVILWSEGAGLEDTPALEASLRDAEAMRVAPDGTVFFLPQISTRVYRIDSAGVVRSVNQGDTAALIDGAPVSSAGVALVNVFLPLAADRILLSAGAVRSLAQLTAGGTVSLWREQHTGRAGWDGGFLRDDRFRDPLELAVLSGGGLAWPEQQKDGYSIRRSFPVPPGCSYSVNAAELPVGGGTGTATLVLSTGADCPWTVGSQANWVEISGKRFGRGSATIALGIRANASLEERTALVLLAGKEVLVRQAPTANPNIFFVTPSAATVPEDGGTVEVSVHASPGLAWDSSFSGAPVTVSGPSAGMGSGAFSVSMDALPEGTQERTAIVSINDSPVILTQRATSAAPVAVTIQASHQGARASIDGVERTLPYVAQWTPGSSHHLAFPEFTLVAEGTLLQFVDAGQGAGIRQRTILTPSSASTITAEYRVLHRIQLTSNLASESQAPTLATEFFGVPVPEEYGNAHGGSTQIHWYPEGATFRVLATQEHNRKFSHFSGAPDPQQNPASIPVTGPLNLVAAYDTEAQATGPRLRLSENITWLLPKGTVAANPLQVTVTPMEEGSLEAPALFVSNLHFIGSPDWLNLRLSGGSVPLTLEAGLDSEKLVSLGPNLPSGLGARVYLHRECCTSHSFEVSVGWIEATEGDAPRLDAITDAGGFRVALPDVTTVFVVSRGMILTLFGARLAEGTASATELPLPAELNGTRVEVYNNETLQWVAMPLFYVSPEQVNFQIDPEFEPSGSPHQPVSIRVRRGDGSVTQSRAIRIDDRSVSLFSANQSGTGAPAGFFVRVLPDLTQQRGELAQCTEAVCRGEPVPVAFGGEENDLYLELYGTGFREAGLPDQFRVFIGGKEAEVTYAGPHPHFAGLDQVNVKVPRDIPGGAEQDVYIWVRNRENAWIASNRLTVRFE